MPIFIDFLYDFYILLFPAENLWIAPDFFAIFSGAEDNELYVFKITVLKVSTLGDCNGNVNILGSGWFF